MMIITLASVASATQAQIAYRMSWTDDTHTEARMEAIDGGNVSPSSVVESYDNWRTADWVQPGETVYESNLRVGTRTIADDLNMITGGVLTSSKHSYVNLSSTQTLFEYRVSERWYSSAGTELQRINYRVVIVGGLPPSFRAVVFSEDGYWDFLQLALPSSFQYSRTFLETPNFDIIDIGVIVGGPHNTGSSSRYVRDMTTGDLIDLGSENSNFALGVRVIAVPTPGVAGFVTLGFIGACRRRR
jgi:hypothetical protein